MNDSLQQTKPQRSFTPKKTVAPSYFCWSPLIELMRPGKQSRPGKTGENVQVKNLLWSSTAKLFIVRKLSYCKILRLYFIIKSNKRVLQSKTYFTALPTRLNCLNVCNWTDGMLLLKKFSFVEKFFFCCAIVETM